VYARRLSQAAKRNALQRRCEIDALACRGLNWTTSTSLMIGDSSLRASLDRHRLLGIEPVVDPISPMLHQLRARAEKRERSVAHVEFRSCGAAVDVDQICFGLAPAPPFLRAICSIASFGIAKFAAIV
jgi:hypothetical protein